MKSRTPAEILVVDDDDGSRQALTNLLRDEGYNVLDIADAALAMDYLRSSPPPRVIVLDLMMPGMDGWDFRHEQKRDPKLAQIPVIAVSAAGKLLDADISLRKPIRYKEFLRAVRQYVR